MVAGCRWIAFLSDRKTTAMSRASANSHSDKAEDVTQVYVISASGGKDFPVTFDCAMRDGLT
jgi:hypothetical protein